MDGTPAIPLRIGDWRVDPSTGWISRGTQAERLEARTMRLLLCLAESAGEVLSIEVLLDRVWPGVVVTHDSVYQAIAALRRLLGDDPKRPQYIATVPRQGYRLVATVGPWGEAAQAPVVAAGAERPGPRSKRTAFVAAGCLVLAAGGALWLSRPGAQLAQAQAGAGASAAPARSVAVLPFLDLTTQEMTEEYVADGLTEELIGDLSGVPGLRVPAPTSSFYYKGKQIPIADAAAQLGVAYLLDGSLRRSGHTVRIAARLLRAADGYVVWTGSYDRPADDVVRMQKDVAATITGAIRPVLAPAAGGSAGAAAH